jgi:hypothetical protein
MKKSTQKIKLKNPILHILFNASDKNTLEYSFKYDPLYKDEAVHIYEPYAKGPLTNLETLRGSKARTAWFNKISETTMFPGWGTYLNKHDKKTIKKIKIQVPKKTLCIWLGHDTNSRIGFLKLMYDLQNTKTEIYVMDYPKKTYLFPGGRFLFWSIGLFNPQQVSTLKKYIRKLSMTERKTAAKKWKEVSAHSSVLRMVDRNGNVKHIPENAFDKILLSHCTNEFKKSARVVGETLCDFMNTYKKVGDDYLTWRLKLLVQSKKIEYEGELRNLRNFNVRLPR